MECKIFRLKRIRAQIRRLLPILFLFFSLLIMLLIRFDSPALVKTRSFMWEIFVPIVSVVRQPVYWVKNGADGLKNWVLTYRENEILKKENQDLKQWRLKGLSLEIENAELKKHLNYQYQKVKSELISEIVLDEGGSFSRSFVVNAGKNQGVVKGMLAFGPNAITGRIVEVGKNYSRLMPFTDYMSRVPVYVGEDRKSAVLMGGNTDMPYLQFLNENDTAQKGDLVVSSGYMGVYPSNLPIGRIYQEDEFTPNVVLFENVNVLSFVRLIDFGLDENLLKQDIEAP